MLTLGVAMWLIAVVTVMRAYGQDQLVTSGVFALVRHPVYSAALVLVLPGVALLSSSWPLLYLPDYLQPGQAGLFSTRNRAVVLKWTYWWNL